MQNADKIKNNLRHAGHKIDELNQWIEHGRQNLMGLPCAYSASDLHVEELTVQLLKAKAQLKREMSKRKQAEKKLRSCQNQVRMLTSELVLTEERERHRLAQDLHDTVAQCLASCRYKLETLQANADFGLRTAQVNDCTDFIDQAIKQTRLLMFEFYPRILHESGLETALRRLAHRFHDVHGIHVECIGDGTPDTLDKDLRVLLFRTIRELLINVVKHAKAKHVTISINRGKNHIRIKVEDDGIGFNIGNPADEQENKNGFGLFSIRERLDRLGGQLDLISHPGQGTHAVVLVPV